MTKLSRVVEVALTEGPLGFARKVSAKIDKKRFTPRFEWSSHPGLIRLGSTYGGWNFIHRENLYGSVMLSCGLGEDASFDVEFAAQYAAQVVILDPTPRSIEHFHAIRSRMGQKSETGYSDTGNQPVGSYDLSEIKNRQFSFIPRALSGTDGLVRFFPPLNPGHVSHSIVNFQKGWSRNSPSIEVESISPAALFAEGDWTRLEIAKFDIEGAEIEVIPMMLAIGITPRQILVEFDELNAPSKRSLENFEMCYRLLRESGYQLVYFNGVADFTFYRT